MASSSWRQASTAAADRPNSSAYPTGTGLPKFNHKPPPKDNNSSDADTTTMQELKGQQVVTIGNNNSQRWPVSEGYMILEEPFYAESRPFEAQFDTDPMKLTQPKDWIARQRQPLVKQPSLLETIVEHSGFRRMHDVEWYDLSTYESASVLLYTYDTCTGRKKFLMGDERRGWSNLGGRRERYETDAAVTAIRELCEETRYVLNPPRTLRLVHYSRNHAIYAGEVEDVPDLSLMNQAPCDASTEKTLYGWIYGRDIIMTLPKIRRQTTVSMPIELADGTRTIGDMMQVMAEEFRHMDPALLVEPDVYQQAVAFYYAQHPKPAHLVRKLIGAAQK